MPCSRASMRKLSFFPIKPKNWEYVFAYFRFFASSTYNFVDSYKILFAMVKFFNELFSVCRHQFNWTFILVGINLIRRTNEFHSDSFLITCEYWLVVQKFFQLFHHTKYRILSWINGSTPRTMCKYIHNIIIWCKSLHITLINCKTSVLDLFLKWHAWFCFPCLKDRWFIYM